MIKDSGNRTEFESGAVRDIAEYYGYEHQKLKAVEEMSELTAAISRKSEIGIIEEIADVQIMMEQLQLLCSGTAEVNRIRKIKIDRQLKRMEDEGNEPHKTEKETWNTSKVEHYKGGFECRRYVESHGLGKGFYRGNIIKYVTRAGVKSKDTELKDLEKAKDYIDFEIERVKNESVNSVK